MLKVFKSYMLLESFDKGIHGQLSAGAACLPSHSYSDSEPLNPRKART